jgi:hypothetical protein
MEIAKGISTQIKKRIIMSKQTAVEWLEQEFIALQNYGVNELGLFLKAKEMEEEQTIDFAIDWWGDDSDLSAKEYYNETFNK